MEPWGARRGGNAMLIPAFKLELNNAILRGLVRAAPPLASGTGFRTALWAYPSPTGAELPLLSCLHHRRRSARLMASTLR